MEKKWKLRKNGKVVSASSENQTPFTFTLCETNRCESTPRLNLPPDKINLRHFIRTFRSFVRYSIFFRYYFAVTEMDFVPIRLHSICLFSAFFSHHSALGGGGVLLLLHVMCIHFVFSFFPSSLLHRYTFLQIQYVRTASVTQSIIFLSHRFCLFMLLFAACTSWFLSIWSKYKVNTLWYQKTANNHTAIGFRWYCSFSFPNHLTQRNELSSAIGGKPF